MINNLFKELAEYKRIAEQAAEQIEQLQNTIKDYMINNNIEVLNGDEHRATYKKVFTPSLDRKGLKAAYPDIVQEFTHTTESKRFTFC